VHELNRRGFLKGAGAATAGTLLGAKMHALTVMQNNLPNRLRRMIISSSR